MRKQIELSKQLNDGCDVFIIPFTLCQSPDQAASHPEEDKYAFPEGWKIPGSYRFCYRYPQMDQVEFTMVLVPLGNVIMVHGKS